MNPHPTPFPGAGKRRPAAIPGVRLGSSRAVIAIPSESKPRRRFGTVLCSNGDRPSRKLQTAKPWKPSGASKATQRATDRASRVSTLSHGSTVRNSKKNQHVGFQEAPLTTVVYSSTDAVNDLACTPIYSSIKKSLELETPYQSAEICSNCRLHRLETSSYWLEQIRLAESVGKHFVSAAFFRLALECKSQPLVILQKELKFYMARHELVLGKSLWLELCQDYVLTSNKLDADLLETDDSNYKSNNVDPDDSKDKCFDSDVTEKSEDFLAGSILTDGSDETYVVEKIFGKDGKHQERSRNFLIPKLMGHHQILRWRIPMFLSRRATKMGPSSLLTLRQLVKV